MGRRTAGSMSAAALGLGYWLFMSPYSQKFGYFPFRGVTSEKVVALSFDDGPNEPFTSEIGSFLHERSIRATFFQVGRCVERHPGVTLRLVEQGHVIGNHSYSHLFRHCLNWPAQRDDIARAQDTLTALLGKRPALFRPPWLFRHPWILQRMQAQGFQTISGEFVHALEVFQPPARRIAARSIAKVRPGSILIFHDGREARGGVRANTTEAVKIVVDRLVDDGFRFATIDELLGVPAYHLTSS